MAEIDADPELGGKLANLPKYLARFLRSHLLNAKEKGKQVGLVDLALDFAIEGRALPQLRHLRRRRCQQVRRPRC